MAVRYQPNRICKTVTDARRYDGCSTCGEVVRKRQQRLTCRECGLLCHRTCSVMTQEDFRRLKREGALDGYRCAACTPDEEAQPIRVREPDVVEPVVPQAAPEEAIIPEPVREEPVVPVPPASSSVIGRVAGGMLSATGFMVQVSKSYSVGKYGNNHILNMLVLYSKKRWRKDGYKGTVEAILKLLNLRIGKRQVPLLFTNFGDTLINIQRIDIMDL